MKTFEEAFHAVVIAKGNPVEFMKTTEFAVGIASQRELAEELRESPLLSFYFSAVAQAVTDRTEDDEEIVPNLMFTVFITGVRIGQEMEKP